MRLIRVFLFSAICYGFGKIAFAQEGEDSLTVVKLVGLKLHKGSVIIHSRDLRPIEDSYPTGLELDLGWHKISQKAWESCECYPKVGVSLTFWDFDNQDVLGQGFTGLFYVEPVFGARRRLSYSVRAAFGLSYQNTPYDSITNPDNLSYSTRVAFPLQLGGSVHYRLSPRWLLNFSLMYNHISNGGIREPNKGINWPSIALGAAWYLEQPVFIKRSENHWRENGPPMERLDLTFFMAYEEPESKLFLFSPGLEVKWSKQFARINAFSLGGEIVYDNGTRYIIESNGDEASPVKAGLALGHEFILGKFLFSQQFGVYIYKPYDIHSAVYQRYGLVYRVNERISAGVNLKVHGHVSNFMDMRLGYSF